MLKISLLGGFSIEYAGVPITGIDTPRLQSLVAYLLLHHDAPQSRAHLAFLFWPDTTESQARTNLRNLLHHLRRTLPQASDYLAVSVQSIHWNPASRFSLDVAEFDAAFGLARQASAKHELIKAREALENAICLYRGDLLPSCYDDWILSERERLSQAYISILEQLVQLHEDRRDYPSAIQHAQRLLQHDPLHEAAYRNLIRLHALNSDRAGALRIFHSCTTILQRELGVEPSAATRAAYEQLLGAETRNTPAIKLTTAISPLVGRELEWSQLLQVWRRVITSDHPHVVMISGEAGIGKTRLAEELLQWAARQGIASANTRCYSAEGALAYAPVSAWLRGFPQARMDDIWLVEVSRLLPEVSASRPDLPQPAALTEAWQRKRLFEALSHAILGVGQPLLLTIDDLQWCDQDTLDWIHFLLRFDQGARLLVVGTYRPEEVGLAHPLGATIQALRQDGQLTEMELEPLDYPATLALAVNVSGKELSQEAAQYLFAQTEGNPFFVIETVRAGTSTSIQLGSCIPDETLIEKNHPGTGDMPPKVRSVLTARLEQVAPSTRELAGLAASIGREFSFELLARSSGRDEGVLVRELDELWQHRIVRERGTNAYDFSHDKLREVAYMSMSAARRRMSHRNIALSLENLNGTDLDQISHQLAVHYERAALPDKAVPYYLRGARAARRLFANDEAIALLRRGVELVEGASSKPSMCGDKPVLALQLWEELGDVFELMAHHDAAINAFYRAQQHLSECDRVGESRLHRKIGIAFRELRHYDKALDACRKAADALGEQPGVDADLWWNEWLDVRVDQVWAFYWLARSLEMEALVEIVRPVVQVRGGAYNQMRFLLASSLMNLRKFRYVVSDETVGYVRESLAESQKLGSLKDRVDNLFELGFLLLWQGKFNEAHENLTSALELSENAGYAHIRTLSLTYLATLARMTGQMEDASSWTIRALNSAESAHMPDYVAAAKANQAWYAWRKQKLDEAWRYGQEALEIWQSSPLVYPFQWLAYWPLIAVAWAQARDETWQYVIALLTPTQQRLPDHLTSALESALNAQSSGDPDHAGAALAQALASARKLGYL